MTYYMKSILRYVKSIFTQDYQSYLPKDIPFQSLLEEVEEIIAMSKQPGWLQKDIAQKFRVPRRLVGQLVREAAAESEKMAARRLRKQLQGEKKDAIEDITADILKSGQPIMRAQQVQLAVVDQRGLEVSTKLVRAIFRKELKMGYRMAKVVPSQINVERALVLR